LRAPSESRAKENSDNNNTKQNRQKQKQKKKKKKKKKNSTKKLLGMLNMMHLDKREEDLARAQRVTREGEGSVREA